jgi:glucose/arabinose dehydrogenase
MTDKQKYPDALSAVWNSGETTVAVSGITFLTSSRWKLWAGWLAVATLKGEHVRLLQINGNGSVVNDKKILTNFGRLRAIIEAPNGDVFIATDNGKGTDKIVRVIPQ